MPAPREAERQALAASSFVPFDANAVVRQVHFAYRAQGSGWRAGHATYEVEVDRAGLKLWTTSDEQRAALSLGRARISRGVRTLTAAESSGRVGPDGHLSFAHDQLVEHLRNSDDGVHQEWSFDRPPAGAGDLLVSVPVEEQAFIGETPSGLHFAGARTGLGFRYGHATWIDRDGHRTELPAQLVAGQIRLRVPERVLNDSSYPALLDPVISPELGVDAPVPVPRKRLSVSPAVACNATGCVVVWQESDDPYNAMATETTVCLH